MVLKHMRQDRLLHRSLNNTDDYSSEGLKKALDKVDMQTVFGPVKFTSYDSKIHQNKMDTYVVQWIDGSLKLIWPKDLANAQFEYPVKWDVVWNK